MERSRAEVEREDARYARERERMVDEQLGGRGVSDERVLAAMRRVPRHLFVQEALRRAPTAITRCPSARSRRSRSRTSWPS